MLRVYAIAPTALCPRPQPHARSRAHVLSFRAPLCSLGYGARNHYETSEWYSGCVILGAAAAAGAWISIAILGPFAICVICNVCASFCRYYVKADEDVSLEVGGVAPSL